MVLIVYLDFEATGLSRWHDHITQIGAVCVRKNKECAYDILGDFETFVFTDRKICDKASEVTGITNEHLKNAPKTKKALVDFFEWISSLRTDDEDVVLVAYNGINYDFPLLCSEMHRWDMNIPRQLQACGVKFLLDPLKWARLNIDRTRLLRKNTGNCSFCLGDVYLALTGDSFSNAHTALADTQALMKVCTNISFDTMKIVEEDHYCLELDKYIIEFMDKRRSIDISLKKNLKTKILSLFDMQKRKKRVRSVDAEPPEFSVKKLKVTTTPICVSKGKSELVHET
jgi:three prime repair exonuclease-2